MFVNTFTKSINKQSAIDLIKEIEAEPLTETESPTKLTIEDGAIIESLVAEVPKKTFDREIQIDDKNLIELLLQELAKNNKEVLNENKLSKELYNKLIEDMGNSKRLLYYAALMIIASLCVYVAWEILYMN